MATLSLIELNHDYASLMNSPHFAAALQEYIRDPSNPDSAQMLIAFGVFVYGSCHSDDKRTRGFRNAIARIWYKVSGTQQVETAR
jgi:hypothetical protein